MPLICYQAFNEVCILANGDAVCSSADAVAWNILGNINRNGIYEIFNGTEYEKVRQKIKESELDSYCPLLKFNCVYKTFPYKKFEDPLKIETVMLETTSYCNLRCPECRSPFWMKFKDHPRLGYLPIDKIE
jgi:hypothetical protein